MSIKMMAICIRCGKVDKDGDMEYDEYANGFICNRCQTKQEIRILSK